MWNLLKKLPTPEISGAILRQHADDTIISNFFDALDLPPVDEIPCPAPGGDGCPRQVRELPDGTFIAVCGRYPQKCSDVYPDSTDRAVYGLNLKRVAALIADGLKNNGVQIDVQTLNEDLQVARVGFYTPRGSTKYPIFLHLPFHEGDRQKACELLLAQNTAFILFLPSTNHLKQDSINSIRKHRSVIVGLSDISEANGVFSEDALTKLFSDFLSLQPDFQPAVLKDKFDTPAGTQWKDISITFIARDTVSIKCGKNPAENYERVQIPGMFVGNEGVKKPSDKWFLLMAFAQWGPYLKREDFQKLFGNTNNKAQDQQKSGLSKALVDFFGLDDAPIPFDRKTKEYKPNLLITRSNCDLSDWINDIHK